MKVTKRQRNFRYLYDDRTSEDIACFLCGIFFSEKYRINTDQSRSKTPHAQTRLYFAAGIIATNIAATGIVTTNIAATDIEEELIAKMDRVIEVLPDVTRLSQIQKSSEFLIFPRNSEQKIKHETGFEK